MTDEESVIETSPEETIDPVVSKIEEAKSKEKARISREEKIKLELEQANQTLRKYQEYEKRLAQQGWNVDELLSFKNPKQGSESNAVIAEISQLKQELENERSLRSNKETLIEIKEIVLDGDYEFIKGYENDILEEYKRVKASNKEITLKEVCDKYEDIFEKEAEELNAIKARKQLKKTSKSGTVPATASGKTESKAKQEKIASKEDEELESLRQVLRNNKPTNSQTTNSGRKLTIDDLINKYK